MLMPIFKYVQCGGSNSLESIAILAGLNKNHYSLIKQFVNLALFGAYDLVRQSITRLPQAVKILFDAFCIIKPLAKNELSVSAVINDYFKK